MAEFLMDTEHLKESCMELMSMKNAGMDECRLLIVAFCRNANELHTSTSCVLDKWANLESLDTKKGSINDEDFQVILHDEDLTV